MVKIRDRANYLETQNYTGEGGPPTHVRRGNTHQTQRKTPPSTVVVKNTQALENAKASGGFTQKQASCVILLLFLPTTKIRGSSQKRPVWGRTTPFFFRGWAIVHLSAPEVFRIQQWKQKTQVNSEVRALPPALAQFPSDHQDGRQILALLVKKEQAQ